jgi:RNA polymerase sigma-70 factor (family 1)
VSNSSNNEHVLFSQVAEGDEKAFHIIFQSYLPKLFPFVIKLTRSRQVAQDLIQDAFIRVWLSRTKLAEVQNPRAWLYKVTANECYRYLRDQAIHSNLEDHFITAPDADNTVHSKLAVHELTAMVAEAVNRLPPQRRLIYRMSRNEGKSIPEIAEALHISPSTVKNALVLSLKFVRKYLIKQEIILPVITSLIYCL